MIYITSDIHGERNIERLSEKNFPEQKSMSEKDYLIVCGDLCAFWDNSENDMKLRARFEKFNFTTLFIDGNHENFDILENTPVTEWNGGKVHIMGKKLIHLMRGQMFNIEGKTFFTMGGGYSGDHYHRNEHVNWWRDEIPTREEFTEGLETLKKANWKTDYVITHTCSSKIMKAGGLNYEEHMLNVYFDYLDSHLDFKKWFFGHYHDDVTIDDKHTLIYNNITRLI